MRRAIPATRLWSRAGTLARQAAVLVAAMALAGDLSLARAQNSGLLDQPTFQIGETIDAGHAWFGRASTEIASAIEYVYASHGEPTAYIVGQEGSGALFGGVRYGEGELRMKSGQVIPVFWQGPSFGLDIGADGSRLLILVYGLDRPQAIFDLFTGPSGLAYVAGGLGVSFHTSNRDIVLGMIRTGVGLRLGVNIGYLRITPRPTWNPF